MDPQIGRSEVVVAQHRRAHRCDQHVGADDPDPLAVTLHRVDTGQSGQHGRVERLRRREGDGGGAGVAGDQLGRGAGVHDAAAAHHRHPITQRFGLVHEMGHQHDRGAPVADVTDRVPHVAAGERVQTLGELVEEHHPGLVEQRQSDEQTLTLTPRQRSETRPPQPGQPPRVQQPVGRVSIPVTEQPHRLVDPQPVRQRRRLQLTAHHSPQPRPGGQRIQPEHPHPAAVGSTQTLQTLHRRRLTRPVHPEDAEDLTLRHREPNIVHSHVSAVTLHQPLHLDHRGHRWPPRRSALSGRSGSPASRRVIPDHQRRSQQARFASQPSCSGALSTPERVLAHSSTTSNLGHDARSVEAIHRQLGGNVG